MALTYVFQTDSFWAVIPQSINGNCVYLIERQKSLLKLKGELFGSWRNNSKDEEELLRIKASSNLSESLYRLQIMLTSNAIVQYNPIVREWQTKGDHSLQEISLFIPFHFSMFLNSQIVSTYVIWLSVGILVGDTRGDATLAEPPQTIS